MEIQKTKIIVEKTVKKEPEYDATSFIQDNSFLQIISVFTRQNSFSRFILKSINRLFVLII